MAIELLTKGRFIDFKDPLNSLASFTVARPNTRLSSAKNKWDIVGPFTEAATPLMAFLLADWCSNADRPSAHKRKR